MEKAVGWCIAGCPLELSWSCLGNRSCVDNISLKQAESAHHLCSGCSQSATPSLASRVACINLSLYLAWQTIERKARITPMLRASHNDSLFYLEKPVFPVLFVKRSLRPCSSSRAYSSISLSPLPSPLFLLSFGGYNDFCLSHWQKPNHDLDYALPFKT